MHQAIIRKINNVLELSEDGRTPISPELLEQILLPELRYKHTKLLYGAEAIDEITGDRRRVKVDERRLYQFDTYGRLLTGYGFADRIYDCLRSKGYDVRIFDASDRKPDLRVDWSALKYMPDFAINRDERALFAELRTLGEQVDPTDEILTSLSRRAIQRDIAECVVNRAARGLGGIVQVPPGVGKSYMFAAFAACLPESKITIVVPDIDNFNKTYRHLLRFRGNVGRIGDGHDERARVMVVTQQSAHKIPVDTDMLLVDEAHKVCGDRTSEAMTAAAPHAVRWALTASPEGRIDNAHAKLEMIFGPVKYYLGWPEATLLGLVVPIEVFWLDMNMSSNPCAGYDNPFLRRKFGIWMNKERNRRIAKASRRYVPEDAQHVILVANIQHALAVRQYLPEYSVVYGTHDHDDFKSFKRRGLLAYEDGEAMAALPDMTSDRREQMRRDFEAGTLKKVIATDVWSTGVSFDALGDLLRADARGSPILAEQIPGRTSRIHTPSGKLVGRVTDCGDEFDRGWAGNAGRRGAQYKDKGWRQRNETTE